ncbi:MAG TPA: hypothetical protein VFT45_14540 [Longimicrobium sp.]|nr:hypothetical protein [Longimicrobium sp.]
MKRPPLWVWALPACVALGVLLGLRLPGARTAPAAAAPVAAQTATTDSVGRRPRSSLADTFPGAAPELATPDSADWGVDGGSYGSLDGSLAGGDTLPAAPETAAAAVPLQGESDGAAPPAASQPPAPPARTSGGPAQELSAADALARPLVAALRGGGRLSFYSAFDAPAARASLVGEWAAAGQCSGSVRLDYEQAAPGLGAVRGVGMVDDPPAWSISLVLPRQHCAAGSARWRASRVPQAEEAETFAALAGGERPAALVVIGSRAWLSWPGRAMVAQIRDERAVEVWSAAAAEGASIRLLGVWQGDGIWVSMETGGRVLRVWRIPQ